MQGADKYLNKTQVKNNPSLGTGSARKKKRGEKIEKNKENDLGHTVFLTRIEEVNERVRLDCFFDDWLKV